MYWFEECLDNAIMLEVVSNSSLPEMYSEHCEYLANLYWAMYTHL